MNNVNAEEQNISNQISGYVSTGQLTPQQGAAFSSELSQISGQAMMGGSNGMAAMNELNGLLTQINASLHAPITGTNPYVWGAATNPYGAATNPYGVAPNSWTSAHPGYYSNWRSNLSQEQNYVRDKELEAERYRVSADNLINKEVHDDAMRNDHNAQVLHNEQVHDVNAANALQLNHANEEARYNTQLNNLKTSQEKETYKRTHPAAWSH